MKGLNKLVSAIDCVVDLATYMKDVNMSPEELHSLGLSN